MEYPFEKITSVAECDALIKVARQDKLYAEKKRSNLQFDLERLAESSEDLVGDLAEAQAEMANLLGKMQAQQPDSMDWKKNEAKRRDLDSRIYRMELRQSQSKGLSLLQSIYELNQADVEVATAEALIAGAEARKAQLSAA